MNTRKRSVVILATVVAVLLSACGASNTPILPPPPTATIVLSMETPVPPTEIPTETPIPSTPTPEKPTHLDLFNGMWVYVIGIKDGNQYSASWVGVEVLRPDPQTVTFSGTLSGMTITLKYDSSQDLYLFSLQQISNGPTFDDFPLAYSESAGFFGEGTIETQGRKLSTTITITKSENGYEWTLTFKDTNGSGLLEYSFETEPKKSP